MGAVKLFFDGGARPNPGCIETCVVLRGQATIRMDHGQGDGHDAEWLALLDALAMAWAAGLRDVILIGDSAPVVGQALGQLRAPARCAAYVERFAELSAGFDRLRIRHVGRKQNLAGIMLERAHGKR